MKDLEKVLKIEDGVLVECDCDFSGDLVIPDSVTKIENQAFCGCDNLTSVVIPDSVTEIVDYAFYCCNRLAEVTIGKSVKTIGIGAFYDCSNLKTINYNATECMSAGFDEDEGCNFSVFDGCTSLTTINIGSNVTVIPESAFWDCDNLTAVHYSGDIASWCKIFFVDLHSNPLNKAHNLYINNELLTDLVVPDSITRIEAFAFAGATCLKSVVISDSVTNIEWSAFLGCTALTTLAIPNSVTRISAHAFSDCSQLATISIPESITSISKSTFFDTAWYNNQPDGVLYLDGWCFGIKGNALAGSLSILEGTRGIASSAFADCSELKSVSLTDTVAYIDDFAFSGCKKLKSVALGKSLKIIGNEAFDDCGKLTDITIPDAVTEIGQYAFRDCKKLNMKIPASVTKFGEYTLSGCYRNSTDIENKYNVTVSDLIWSYKHGIHISFSLAEQPKKCLVLSFPKDNFYQLHDNNETGNPYTEEELDRLMRSIADYMQVGEKLTTRGGVTPGGLNLIKRFTNYGFDKVGDYCDEFGLKWSGEAFCKIHKIQLVLDYEKFAEWLSNPAHKNDFKVLDDNAPVNEENTSPIVWELEKK